MSEHRPEGSAGGDATSGAAGVRSATFDVPSMDCPSCASTVGRALDGVTGVHDRTVDPTLGTVEVAYDPGATSSAAIARAVEAAGYAVVDDDADGADGDEAEPASTSAVWTSPRALTTFVSGLFLGLGVLLEFGLPGLDAVLVSFLGTELRFADALLLVATAAGGQVIVRNGYYSARNLRLDIDFLMSAAILAATGVSLAVPEVALFIEAASIAFLFNVAELLERYSVERARSSVAELVSLSPDTAVVRRDGEPVEVPVEDVAVGEVVVVEPGARVSMDGVVVEGESAVDESAVTGESVPVDKLPGDEVYAGSVNARGYLEVEVTVPADERMVERIADLVAAARKHRTRREQFVDRFARYYTPTVVSAAVLTAAVPPMLGEPWVPWFLRGISLLVIACPCAFVISTPVTVVSGVTSAARNGVLVKGGDRLEAMGEVDAVAFDKTGTLTAGDLAVTDVIPLGEHTEADVLRCAGALERRSEHPIGDAIVERAERAAVADQEIANFESLTGRGVTATLDELPHYAGTPALFRELGFDLGHVHFSTDGGRVIEQARSRCPDRDDCVDLVEDVIPRLRADGKTIVLVGTEDELEGVIAVADRVRPGARNAVAALREAGVDRLVMLTGDSETTARAIADEVDVDEFRAGLLPDEKVAAVEALREQYGTVAMVGDGINDAPALAAADVGIAMGAAGSDAAIETADIALMADDLRKLPYLYRLSRSATGVIRQNIWSSLGIKAVLAIGIPLGYVSVVAAILVGDVGMTTAVTANALRLSGVAPDDPDEATDSA